MVSGRKGSSAFGLRLDRLGFNLRTFAAYIGASEVTVRRWSFPADAVSHVPLPPPIQRLLDLLEDLTVPRPSQDPDGLSIAATRYVEIWLERAGNQGWQKAEAVTALRSAIDEAVEPPPDL
jgi:hypothetical protein